MRISVREKDPFEELQLFLVQTYRLDEIDAKIYTLALKKGMVTSGIVINEMPELHQPTVSDKLRRLANKGFLAATPRVRGTKSDAKRYPSKYLPVSPRLVLKDSLAIYEHVNKVVLSQIDEHMEVLSTKESEELDEDIWITKPEEIAMIRWASAIQNAKNSVQIYSHDCTWFNDDGIRNALRTASSQGVKVEVIATQPDSRVISGLSKIGINVNLTNLPNIPFCVIDKKLLFIPFRGGKLGTRYLFLMSGQKYLVENFMKFFSHALGQSHGGDVNV